MPAGFVGRAGELRALADLVHRAGRAPAPAVALVIGQPGQGKTRLLAEFCAGVPAAQRVRVAGHEPESAVPLAAVRDLLRLLSAGPDGGLVERLLFAPSAAPIETFQLFEASFRALAGGGPLTVVVDDLQWVDGTSVALLHYLVRAAETTGHPLALVAAGRPTGPSIRLAESLAGVVAPDRLLRIELGPLDRAAGVRLARELAGVDEPGAAALWQRAEGSPFWIEALARERCGHEPGGPFGRLRALSAEAAALLAVLALAGRPIDRSALADLADRPSTAVGPAVDELIGTGLVTDGPAGLAVAHDLIRERVTADLPPDRARRLHRQLAGWLERRAADDGALLEALEHGRRGGLAMVGPALRLAESPRRRLLGTAGLELLRAVAEQADPSAPGVAALARATARLATDLGEHESAFAAWSAIVQRAPAGADGAEAALAASECALHLGRAAEAERFLDRAARVSGVDERTAVEVDARAAAVLLWLRHRSAEGEERARRAVRAARRLAERAGGTGGLAPGERRAYLRAVLAGAEAAILADRPVDVLALSDELAAVATAEDSRIRLRALAEGSLALRWTGRGADAEARLRLAWEEARAEALPQATVEVGVLLAKVLHSAGRLTEAADVLAECDRLGRRLAEYCPSRAFSSLVAHLLEASRGEWRRAAEGLLSAAGGEPDPHYRAHLRLERALLSARYDPRRLAEGIRADVDGALADAAASGCRRCVSEVTARTAEALARIGDAAAAEELLRSWAPDPGGGNRLLLWWGGQARAAVSSAEGGGPPAVRAWTETVEEADRCGLVLEALWARLDLARELAVADRPAAAAVLREAGRSAEDMGARTELSAVEQGLRALGVRTWRRAAGAGAAVLTDREREIAERVAAGANNTEIAAAMFLSRKTVERHVSNVLAKSGLRNRAELAARWASGAERQPEGLPR